MSGIKLTIAQAEKRLDIAKLRAKRQLIASGAELESTARACLSDNTALALELDSRPEKSQTVDDWTETDRLRGQLATRFLSHDGGVGYALQMYLTHLRLWVLVEQLEKEKDLEPFEPPEENLPPSHPVTSPGSRPPGLSPVPAKPLGSDDSNSSGAEAEIKDDLDKRSDA
jgi:hypothetical protein